jgi:hypothetical protein
MKTPSPIRSLMLSAIILLVAGCGGEEQKNGSALCDTPAPAACYMVKGAQGGWLYDTVESCELVTQGAVRAADGACANDGVVVDICDSPEPPPGAPACYAIHPNKTECPLGDCAVEYRIADFCGVRGEVAEIVDPGYCDGSLPKPTTCSQLNGRTYYSKTLEDGGITPYGVSKMHWKINFANGVLQLHQADYVMIGAYTCENEQVIATINNDNDVEHLLEFTADLNQFTLNQSGNQTITYVHYDGKPDLESCNAVRGQYYSSGNRFAPEQAPPVELEFAENFNYVSLNYNPGGDSGYYDCELGELHLHLSGNQAHPLRVAVAPHGQSVVLFRSEHDRLTLTNFDNSTVCTTEYAPVCAAFDTGIRCITTPCPSSVYRTYGNRCNAELDVSAVLFDGECGKLEGQPIESEPVFCPAIAAPVCAKAPTNVVCVTSPCESHQYKTFGNGCEAAGARAAFSFDGHCNLINMEGLLSFAQEPVRLYNLEHNLDGGLHSEAMPKGSSVTVGKASILDNVLTVTLSYSGCKVQPIHFNVDAAGLLKSAPPQLVYSFTKDVEDVCEAYFTSTYEFDLLPISKRFSSEGKNGIAILGLNGPIYRF